MSRNQSIVIIGINFYPEETAIGLYTTQLSEFLYDKGYDVTIITGFPYYPNWSIYKPYLGKPRFLTEKHKGISVLRYKQYVPNNPSFLKRIFHMLDFILGSYFNLKRVSKADVVLSIVPFTLTSFLGNILAKRKNAKHWIHIQDFEFDAAIESGLLSSKGLGKYVSKLLNQMETKLLNTALVVSTISNSMMRKLKSKSLSDTYYFPNWVDEKFINPNNAKSHKYLKSNKFKILYSGNIGAKQDWDTFFKVVEYFGSDETVQFIVVGDGAMRASVEERIKKFNNVVLHAPVPYSELNHLLCSANLHILFQKEDVIDTVMPSKILGMMASSVPVLITGNTNSEVCDIFSNSKMGYFMSNLELKPIVEKIVFLKENRNHSLTIGLKARQYVINHFSKDVVLNNFYSLLNEI